MFDSRDHSAASKIRIPLEGNKSLRLREMQTDRFAIDSGPEAASNARVIAINEVWPRSES